MGEKLRVAMWKSIVDKGVGGLLAPWQAKRMALAQGECRRLDALAVAQAEQLVEGIKSGDVTYHFDTGSLLPSCLIESDDQGRVEPFITEELFSSVLSQDAAICMRKDINISKALFVAESCLMDDWQDEPPTIEIEDDWLFTWREYAGRISQAELQELWGRLLANEFKAPGTFSLRTLNFLKTLNKKEADLICKLGEFVICDRVIDIHNFTIPIEFEDFLHLHSIGVLDSIPNSVQSRFRSDFDDRFYSELLSKNKKIVLSHDDGSRCVSQKVIALSNVGVEVLKLACVDLNEGYLNAVVKMFQSHGLKVEVKNMAEF